MRLAAKELGGVLGRCRVDRQRRGSLQAGDHAQPGMEFPMPVVGLLDSLTTGCGMQEQVVRRIAQRIECAKGSLQRGAARLEAAGAKTTKDSSPKTSRSPASSSVAARPHHTQVRLLIMCRAPPPISSATQCGI